MNISPVTPWYKQFWPWFLMAIPLSSVMVGIVMFRFANDGTNALVVDDYYKEGKTINARLDKISQAQALNIQTLLTVSNDEVSVSFQSGSPISGEALQLDLFHVTLPKRDRKLLLTRDATGVYRGLVDFPIDGKWRLRLMPLDEEWKVQNTLYLPQINGTPFNP